MNDVLTADPSSGAAVVFQGGEPTLSPTLADDVRRVVSGGATRVVVQTNGRTLAEDDLAKRLKDAGVSAVDVSLHGSTAPMHEHHTRRSGSFDQTLAGIDAARAAGIEVGTTTVVTRSNMRHLDEILLLAADHGATSAHLVGVAPRGRALRHADMLVPNAELLSPHLAKARARAASKGVRLVLGDPPDDPLFAGLGAFSVDPFQSEESSC